MLKLIQRISSQCLHPRWHATSSPCTIARSLAVWLTFDPLRTRVAENREPEPELRRLSTPSPSAIYFGTIICSKFYVRPLRSICFSIWIPAPICIFFCNPWPLGSNRSFQVWCTMCSGVADREWIDLQGDGVNLLCSCVQSFANAGV